MDRLRANPWVVLLVLCMGFFMILLDLTIVNIAIPSIIKSLNASLDEILWVLNAYILAYAVLLITFGRLGDLFGQRNMFIAGLAVFTVASAVSGLSQSTNQSDRRARAAGDRRRHADAANAGYAHLRLSTGTPGRRLRRLGRGGGGGGHHRPHARRADHHPGRLALDLLRQHPHRRCGARRLLSAVAQHAVRATLATGPGRRGAGHRGTLPYHLRAHRGRALRLGHRLGVRHHPTMLIVAGLRLLGVFVLWERGRPQPLMPLSLFRDRNYSVMNWVSAVLSFGMLGMFLPLDHLPAVGAGPERALGGR